MLSFQNISKRFPGSATPALYPIQFEVAPGSVLGLVGRNGAGKSTLLRLAVGLIRPSGGKVLVGGHDVARDGAEARRVIGWVPENPRFDPGETPAAILEHLAALDGRSDADARRRREAMLELVELTPMAGRPVRTLSQGQLRRLSLAAAWLGDPTVHLYDEPTNGLDAAGRRLLEARLREVKAAGGCAILSTHRLDEIESWCDRIALLKAGRLAAVVPGGAAGAKAARRVRIVLERPPEARWPDLKALGTVTVTDEDLTLDASVPPGTDLVGDLATRGYRIREVQSVREDVAQLLDPEPGP